MEMCADIFQPFDTLPKTNAEICASLRTALPVRIPLQRGVLPAAVPAYVRDSIETGNVGYTALALQELMEPLVSPSREAVWSMSGSENAKQWIWDKLITSVYQAFVVVARDMGIRMDYDRNKKAATANTTVLDFRPDFLWMFQRVLLFRGEEKATDGELEDAVHDNNRKIHWHVLIYGTELPYVLTYAAAGNLIRFYVLRRNSSLSEPVTGVLNVTSPSDRLEVLFCVMNIMRLCLTLSPMCPADALSVGHQLTTRHGSVTINERYVLKVVHIAGNTHLTAVDTLRQLYADLEAHSVPFTTRAFDIRVKRTNELHLKIAPLALQVYPQTEADLKGCIRCLLRALVALHNLGWVHRDIRWPNVLRTASEWILSDFENSGHDNSAVTWNNPALPLEVQNGAPYLKSADMYQIGYLMVDPRLTQVLTVLARAFRDKCLDDDPSKRPTAEQALQDPWLLVA